MDPVELRLDELFDGLAFATVLAWHKQEGDAVRAGEPILEVEADKANHDIGSPAAGTLTAVVAAAGDEIRVGDLLAVIEPA